MSGDTIIKGRRVWPSFVLLVSTCGLVSTVLGPAWEVLPLVVVGASILLQAAGMFVSLALIVKPIKLTLGDEGFTIEPSMAKARVISWRDVETVPARIPPRAAWLSWTPREDTVLPGFVVKRNEAACLPCRWTLSVEEIQRLMNDRLNKARQ